VKFQFIRDHREHFPVRLMCQVLDASSSGFYDWLRRPESLRAAEDRALVEKIQAVHSESRRTYGSPRVHASLKAEGYRIGRKRVARLRTTSGPGPSAGSGSPPTAATIIRLPPTFWTGSSRSRRRTRSGWPT
jgi:hypothetical protein